MTLTAEQARAIELLHLERALLANPFDRIVFDNQHIAELPGLPVGLWLLAHPLQETSK
jgi:hypothetical protein